MKRQELSQSMDSIATSEHSQVTLTRFNTLSYEPHTNSHESAPSPRPNGNSPRPNGKQWGPFKPFQRPHEDSSQFQIVWRQLSFEVDTMSYDKIISSTINKFSALLTGGAAPTSQPDSPRTSRRMVFENVSGYVKSDEITAILGPSGAGKTSLLNAICGRTSNYRGYLQLLGCADTKRMRSVIIPQKDYLIEKLTVSECLYYASKIKNSDKSFDHEANIRRVVEMLNLGACFSSSISKISGGEHKRVSIAQELLSQPDILILDEPTSGLDSLSCRNLVRSLSSLIQASRRGHLKPLAIVMTIHQPDVDVFNMFDHVYCMARTGQVIYDGRPGDTIRVITSQAKFDASSSAHELPAFVGETEPTAAAPFAMNPANLLIEIASGEYGAPPIESLAKVQAKQFEVYSMELQLDQQPGVYSIPVEEAGAEHKPEQVNKLVRDKRLSPAGNATKQESFLYHTNLLARRAFLATLRDPMISLVSLIFYLAIPIVMFVVYPSDIGRVAGCPVVVREMETLALAGNQTMGIAEELQEQLSTSYECAAMFFIVINAFCICSIAVAALSFPMNMHVLLKEARNGWYSLSAFVTAESLASLPFQVLFPVVSTVLIYQLLDMPSSPLQWRMWAIGLVVVVQSLVGQTFGLIFGALCMDSVQSAIFMGLASTLPMILVSGFAVRLKSMPSWLRDLSHLSPYRYVLHLSSMIRFGFGLCPCDESTGEYLRDTEPHFTDIPRQIHSVFSYYLTGMMPDGDEPGDNATSAPGIYYGFKLNSSERADLAARLSSNEVDLFSQMADQMSRSFSFGQSIEDCDKVRPQLLNMFNTPPDRDFPLMFTYLIGILVAMRVVLFLTITLRIRSRI